jgi:hypothetical protein
MAISNSNELYHLLSLILGDEWEQKALAALDAEGLQSIVSLAESHASSAMVQMEAVGHLLADGREADGNHAAGLGWVTDHLAEWAGLCSTLSESARSLSDPRIRAAYEMPSLAT